MSEGTWSSDELEWASARYVPRDAGTWRPAAWSGIEQRPLGLDEVSGGLLEARHLRRAPGGPVDGAPPAELDLHLLYVLAGALTVVDADGASRTLTTGGTAYHPAGSGFRVTDATDDFEAVQLTSAGPAAGDARRGEAVYALADDPATHVLGDGPRPDVRYRHLRVAEHSGGRYRAWVVSAAEARRDMSIWHYHDMAQFFVVLGGWALVEVRGEAFRVQPGDALAIGAGPANQHNVRHIGEGFRILELCVPAEYGTWPGTAPDGD